MEKCSNPLNPSCKSSDIILYIIYDGRRLPICRRCWEQIAETDLEWGDGVSGEKLKRQIREAKEELLEKVKGDVVRKMIKKFMRKHRAKFGKRSAAGGAGSGGAGDF